jgi:CheY-like chemotaxis protein
MDAARTVGRIGDEIARAARRRRPDEAGPWTDGVAGRAPPHPSPSQRFDLRALNIVVVDDSKPSMNVIRQTLLGFGVTRTVAFSSVAPALERLAVDPFDLIIADAEMPGENGYDLVRRLRAQPGGPNYFTAIMLASGYAPLSKVAHARDLGANMVILKPISPSVLLSHIEWLAKHPRPFIDSPNYHGPCRRVRQQPLPDGVQERRAQPAPAPQVLVPSEGAPA